MVFVNSHEQLNSGIYLGKELLMALSLELGPVYRIFMLPINIIFGGGGECMYINWEGG